jgi:hypothetical protein
MKWISVEEKLPESNVIVLAYDGDRMRLIHYSRTKEHGNYWVDNSLGNPKMTSTTHWLPIPELPEL